MFTAYDLATESTKINLTDDGYSNDRQTRFIQSGINATTSTYNQTHTHYYDGRPADADDDND